MKDSRKITLVGEKIEPAGGCCRLTVMRNFISITIAGLLLAGVSLYGQTKAGAKGDSAKGKGVFDQNCAVCHNADNNEKKMGPGLKGVAKKVKDLRGKVEAGGNGMPAYKDMLSSAEKDNVVAYLGTL